MSTIKLFVISTGWPIMRKDDSGIKEWCKHTRNAAVEKRGVNKTNRRKVKHGIKVGLRRGRLEDCKDARN